MAQNDNQGKKLNARRQRAMQDKGATYYWPFGLTNYIAIFVSLLIIGVGYIFLGIGPYDSTESVSVGPALLTLGYGILVPLAVILPSKKKS
jgi:hypothetical protein